MELNSEKKDDVKAAHTSWRRKKARYMSLWESSLYEKSCSPKSLSLSQLFDARQWQGPGRRCSHETTSRRKAVCCKSTPCGEVKNDNKSSNLPPTKKRDAQKDSSVSLRLEHREGGALATHRGEERILLFRSDRPGAIAKIIFSSSPGNSSSEENNGMMAEAKVHVLDVKGSYRGYDLGGLLFSEALLALRHRYMESDNAQQTTSTSPHAAPCSVRCQLDAEEDIRRHNKLVSFYERLGCIVKPQTRPQFLNNNDGETYRKVPMQIELKDGTTRTNSQSLVGRPGGFVPVLLLGSNNKPCTVAPFNHQSDSIHVHWLMVEDGCGHVQFRSTKGRYLTMDSHGNCLEDDKPEDDRLSEFHLLRVSDRSQHVLSGDDDDDSCELTMTPSKELWLLMSSHGTFLSQDYHSWNLYGSKTPVFWQANSGDLSLTCTRDTPTRRQHYRRTWIKQTVDYVTTARKRYLDTNLGRMSVKDALDLLKRFSAFPFRLDPASRGLSFRTLAFRTAEAARAAGHPDWIQFIALIHGLGRVINCIDANTAIASEDDYDWTIPCRSRVVGCAAPGNAIFSEFAELNEDEYDDRFNSQLGIYNAHCGLENVLLSWSGPEYLHHMLKHNNVGLPEEGFSVIRLFPLFDWHTNNLYENLANEDDEDIQSFVADFDRLRRRVRQDTLKTEELSDDECNKLWDSYYAGVAAKFGCDGILKW